jgi:uncharacterized membrane protein (Fun14 family)
MAIPGNTKPTRTGRPPFWKARSLFIALGMMLVGLLMWTRTPSGSGPQAGTPHGGSALAESSPAKAQSVAAAKPTSPALFRFGASYIAGFVFGWICRKSIKFGLMAAGAAAIVITVAKQTGFIDLDWASLQAHISQSLAWLHGELGAVRHFITGYLPSAAAGCVGIFMGARHR